MKLKIYKSGDAIQLLIAAIPFCLIPSILIYFSLGPRAALTVGLLLASVYSVATGLAFGYLAVLTLYEQKYEKRVIL